jgi:hypothetical protein
MGAVTADSPVRSLYGPLRSLAMQRVDVALRVAVMIRAGYTHREMVDRLEITASKLRRALDDLRQISDSIEIGERPEEPSSPLSSAHSSAHPLPRDPPARSL